MTIKQMIACLATVAIFMIGGTGIAIAQQTGSTGEDSTLAAPDIDSLDADLTKSDEDAGPSCFTRGVPECGGSCEISCKKNEQASCIAGSCDPNNTFACTCTVVTSCKCN